MLYMIDGLKRSQNHDHAQVLLKKGSNLIVLTFKSLHLLKNKKYLSLIKDLGFFGTIKFLFK